MNKPGPKPKPAYERMMSKVHFCPASGCWLFSGDWGDNGHGNVGN